MPMLLTRHEVEMLGIPAVNKTRLHYEDGIDYDLWRYSPEHGYTDGHDHGAHGGFIPDEGWEPQVTEVTLPVEKLAALLRGMAKVERDILKIAVEPKKADRCTLGYGLAAQVRLLLGNLLRKDSRCS